jgi:hypothetical protein
MGTDDVGTLAAAEGSHDHPSAPAANPRPEATASSVLLFDSEAIEDAIVGPPVAADADR